MTNSAVPPCLPEIRPLCTVPTHRLPVNAGNASEDTEANLFPLPSAAHLLLRFSRRSQPEETLNKSSAVDDRSFDPTMQFEKLEIHTVFLRFQTFICAKISRHQHLLICLPVPWRHSLWMRWQLYSRFYGLWYYVMLVILQMCPFVKNKNTS